MGREASCSWRNRKQHGLLGCTRAPTPALAAHLPGERTSQSSQARGPWPPLHLVQFQPLLFTSNLLTLAKPQFSHRWNGNDASSKRCRSRRIQRDSRREPSAWCLGGLIHVTRPSDPCPRVGAQRGLAPSLGFICSFSVDNYNASNVLATLPPQGFLNSPTCSPLWGLTWALSCSVITPCEGSLARPSSLPGCSSDPPSSLWLAADLGRGSPLPPLLPRLGLLERGSILQCAAGSLRCQVRHTPTCVTRACRCLSLLVCQMEVLQTVLPLTAPLRGVDANHRRHRLAPGRAH